MFGRVPSASTSIRRPPRKNHPIPSDYIVRLLQDNAAEHLLENVAKTTSIQVYDIYKYHLQQAGQNYLLITLGFWRTSTQRPPQFSNVFYAPSEQSNFIARSGTPSATAAISASDVSDYKLRSRNSICIIVLFDIRFFGVGVGAPSPSKIGPRIERK